MKAFWFIISFSESNVSDLKIGMGDCIDSTKWDSGIKRVTHDSIAPFRKKFILQGSRKKKCLWKIQRNAYENVLKVDTWKQEPHRKEMDGKVIMRYVVGECP